MFRAVAIGSVVAGLAALMTLGGCSQSGGSSGWSGGSTGDNSTAGNQNNMMGMSTGGGSGFGGGAMAVVTQGSNERVEAYAELVKHGTDAEKLEAAQRLGTFGDNHQAIEALERGCKDSNPDVRAACADSLRRIGSAEAMDELREAERKGRVPASAGGPPPTTQPSKMKIQTKEKTVEIQNP